MYQGLMISLVFLPGLFKPVLLFHFSLLGPVITNILNLNPKRENFSGSVDNKEVQPLWSLIQGIPTAFCCGAWQGTRQV